ESAREQQRDDIREQVGAGHPDELVGGGAELGDEGVSGHRHDRLIHQDHEEPDDDGRESLPRAPLGDHGHAIAPRAASSPAANRYMATGSATLSPRGNAVVGVVGETSTSTFSYAASKSRAISVRIFCACP